MSDNGHALDTDTLLLANLRELRAVRQILSAEHEQADLSSFTLGLSNGQRRVRELQDWPIHGAKRYIRGGPGYGAVVALAAGVPQLLIGANEALLGGQIVNYGPNPMVLWLCSLTDQQAGIAAPQLWISSLGGAWDFTLSHSIWCGDVVGVSILGTNVTVATV